MLNSTRRNISYPNPDRSDRPDVPAHILNLVNALEADVIYVQGTDAARLAAAHQASGGRIWWTTDTHLVWYDDGATWWQVGITAAGIHLTGTLGARPAANTVAAGVLYRATDVGLVYYSDGAAWTIWSTAAGQEIDYKQITADVTGLAATSEATATAFITGNSVTFDGSRVKLELFIPGWNYTGGSGTGFVVFYRDAVVVGRVDFEFQGVGGQNHTAGTFSGFDTPSAGAHQYSARYFTGTTVTQTIKAGLGGAGAYLPAYLRVTKA